MKALTLNLRLFAQGAYLSYVALFSWLRPTQYLATKFLGPLGQILFFTFLGMHASGGQDADFYIIGNSVQLAALSGIFGVSMSIGGERWSGTLPYLFGTPANRFFLFVGRSVIHIFDGMLGVGIGFAIGVLLLGLDLSGTDPAALILVIFITTFSTSGMGLMLGSLSLITRNVMFVNNTVYFLMLLVSGANIPLQNLPSWVLPISKVMPLTRGIAATRLVIEGATIQQVSGLLIEEILIGVIYLSIGYIIFHRFEQLAKRMGTLEVA